MKQKRTALPLEHVAGRAIMELKDTRRALEFATVKLATAQAENRRLRRLTANGRQGRILSRASADAKQIIAWRWAGFSVNRAPALSYGMSRTRWAWAVALLERARVVAADARPLDTAFDEDLSIEDMVEAIDRTVRVLEQKGLDSLVMRMPKNGRRGARRSSKGTRK
jgi:hypothetical protein